MTYIPEATQAKLAENHPEGTRHKAAMDIAISLIGNGLSGHAVFAELRSKFPPDVSDKELDDIVRYAEGTGATPSGFGERRSYRTPSAPEKPAVKRSPQQQCDWWLSNLTKDTDAFRETSKVPIPEDPVDALYLLLNALYFESEHVNILGKFVLQDDKPRPSGPGKTMTRLDWQSFLHRKGIPKSESGVWIRPNPVKPVGSGKDGAITDADVVAFRFLLLESDAVPIPTQLALYSKLKLPIAAVILSGGKSAHAWCKLDSLDEPSYTATAKRILTALGPFGVDQANKNPSRLSRLAGAHRSLGAVGDGMQSLLWLCPTPAKLTDTELAYFEESLLLPAIEEKPCQRLVQQAVLRYEELMANRGKLGVPTGIEKFDHVTGGLKPGQMTVLAAESNGGKSTFALNMINRAVSSNLAVALFTLEMDRDEMWDLLTAMNAGVNRNLFNTGRFVPEDISAITKSHGWMKDFPLWIFDESTMSCDQIRHATMQLKAERDLRLVVIDYAQLVLPDNPKEIREQQVALISRNLRALAKDAKVPIVVLSQVNEEGKLRESRALSHDAHNVIVLESNCSVMNVTKGRSIPKRKYELEFDPLFAKVIGKP